MEREAINNLLEQGKEAARRGDDALAQRTLRAVVEAEPENEAAWLWLSAVVDSDSDRRLCLENVLVLNPGNQAARKGLQRLGPADEGEAPEPGDVVRQHVPPLTPAAAILYPERQNRSWRWHDATKLEQREIAGFSAESSFDDVWHGDGELCAYCAAELSADDTRCPKCARGLYVSGFRYPRASSNLTIYWVLILGVAQTALALVLVNLLSQGSPATLAWQSLIFISMVLLAIGVAFRRFWAYAGSIVALLMVLTAMIFGWLFSPTVDESLAQLTGREFFLTLSDRPYSMLSGTVTDLLNGLQYLAVPLALLFALFRAGPDFEKLKQRRIARVRRGISDASHFYGTGREYAERGMWASAVLHYQRAAALEPAQPYYQRALGDAYAQLGHYQRGLDVLKSARQLTRDPEARTAIDGRISEIRRLAEVERPASSRASGAADSVS